jgi:hypothetical protein
LGAAVIVRIILLFSLVVFEAGSIFTNPQSSANGDTCVF